MSTGFQSTEFSTLSDANKQLMRIYANSILASAAASLVLDSSLGLNEVNLDESVYAIINAIQKDKPEVTLRELVDEALLPLQAVISSEDLLRAGCYYACIASGKTTQECNNKCGTNHKPPLE
jgi:hypothetical protein